MIDDFGGAKKSPQPNNVPKEDFLPDLSQAGGTPENTSPNPGDFITPGQAAAQDTAESVDSPASTSARADEVIEFDNTGNEPTAEEEKGNKPPKERWWKRAAHAFGAWFSGLRTWQKVLFIAVVVALVAGLSFGAYALLSKEAPEPKPVPQAQPEPKPETVPSTLTGLEVKPELNNRAVTGVMIENSMEARPQSGLKEAGVVFEAIAEGGITRFLALYQDTEAESVGPIRSARPYYIDWLLGFDAGYAHVGGSPEALNLIRSLGVRDLDQFSNAGTFRRVTNKYAPHNVYSSVPDLRKLQENKGYGKSSFSGFVRKKQNPAATPTAATINLNISSARYNVRYTYNAESNSYTRAMGGVAHLDEQSGDQLTPQVVVAMVMRYGIHADGQHSVYNTIGSGKVYIFQDGTVAEGTWEKTGRESQIKFTDASGKTISLNPGQTWLTMVNSAGSVSYQP